MPIAVDIDHDNRLVTMTASDPITRRDVLVALDTQALGGGWGYRQVGDYSRSTWTPTVADVDAFVSYTNLLTVRHGRRGRTALVAGDSLATYGMARMYSLRTERQANIQAFRTLAEARAWLDAPDE